MVVLTIPKVGLIHKPHLLAITLSLVIALGLVLQSLVLPSSLFDISSLSFIQDAFADHGQEIVLSLNESSFAQKSPEGGNQVIVVVNYATQDPMAVHDLVKGVMKVYSPNGTLLKTSSSPTPFPISESGKAQLATTLTDNSVNSATANIVFTNPIRTEMVSNELPVKIGPIKRITATLPDEKQPDTELVQEKQPAVTAQIPTKNEAVIKQPKIKPPAPVENEEIPEHPLVVMPQKGKQSIAPMEPFFQGTPPTFTSETTINSTIEICNDGLDNDADTQTDFEDSDCLALTSPSPPQPAQEDQLTAASLEVCDDAIDNDLDGKTDLEDEECMSTAPLNQQLAPNLPKGQEAENSNEEEQQSDEDDENDNDDDDDDDDDGNNEDLD
jgi:hypothetical protein